ncbi:MAG: transposase [Patescibacteria group bacterium]
MLNMTSIRKDSITTGEIYHIYTRSISGFEIFRTPTCYERLIEGLCYYSSSPKSTKLSDYLELSPESKLRVDSASGAVPSVKIIAYCVMPTHIHLVLKQLVEGGISSFMNNLLNSFARYFNISHNRRGPLWESRFKNVLVQSDEQLLHLTRYLHLNPVSADLIAVPDQWVYSSYCQYIGENTDKNICNWEGVLDIQPKEYRKFVSGRISYQRSLSKIKHLLIENYTG